MSKQVIKIPVGATEVIIETVDDVSTTVNPAPILVSQSVPEANIDFTITDPEPPNQIPTVSAGIDQTIVLPVNSVTLTATASDPDGNISMYVWEKVSGSGVIDSPNSATTKVTGLTVGSSIFRVTVIDNKGASNSDDVSIVVNDAVVPPTPGYQLVFESGYDQDNDIRNDSSQQAGRGVISKTVYKVAPGSFYSIPENVSSGIRSEVQYTSSVQNPTEGAIEFFARYEVIIPDNGHSLQWHPNTSGGSASPGLWHINGRFVMVNWYKGGNYQYPTGITIQANKWYQIRMEHKFGSAGYFRLYIDGVLAVQWTGRVGDGSGQYLKVGYNGWNSNSANSRIYYDQLKIYRKV